MFAPRPVCTENRRGAAHFDVHQHRFCKYWYIRTFQQQTTAFVQPRLCAQQAVRQPGVHIMCRIMKTSNRPLCGLLQKLEIMKLLYLLSRFVYDGGQYTINCLQSKLLVFVEEAEIPLRLLSCRSSPTTRRTPSISTTSTPNHCESSNSASQFAFLVQLAPPVARNTAASATRSTEVIFHRGPVADVKADDTTMDSRIFEGTHLTWLCRKY